MVLAVVLDALTLLVLVGSAARGAKRGFLMTVSSLIAIVCAVVGAVFCLSLFEVPVRAAITPRVTDAVAELIPETDFSTGGKMSYFGIDIGGFVEAAADDARDAAVISVSGSLAASLSRILVGVAAFLIILLAAKLLLRLLDQVLRLPGLNFINRLGGLVAGAVFGLVLCMVLAKLVSAFTGLVPPETVEASLLFGVFARHNLPAFWA
ncbi:CvpA family protein [Oscillospiraceae bacterium OttesenSCG-928-F05]|nr:CvpA family protein [Oscillospiraceae bacterium OttesenSCG-928-F05]